MLVIQIDLCEHAHKRTSVTVYAVNWNHLLILNENLKIEDYAMKPFSESTYYEFNNFSHRPFL